MPRNLEFKPLQSSKLPKASLIISLDFELHWGRFDKYDLTDYQSYYKTTLQTVPRILELFEKYQIRATWATVGMLMAENWEEWKEYSPVTKPDFFKEKYSAYNWAEKTQSASLKGLFAPELVRLLCSLPGQELASHTYSHFYTGEKGSSLQAFQDDLYAAKKIAASKFGKDLESLVFPRNQYHEEVLKIAASTGFKAARTNPNDWFWKETAKENLLKKVFRTGDTLFPMGKSVLFDLEKCDCKPILQIPASRLLRPYKSNSVFNKIRIDRIKSEIEEAIRLKKAYHLWWHPHNFGHLPKENLDILDKLLSFIQKFIKDGSLESLNMADVSETRLTLFPNENLGELNNEKIKK